MQGAYDLNAPRDEVWAALNDPDVLEQCIPGCESIEKLSDTSFAAVVKAKVGPVKATFKGKVELTELDPPNGYTISGEGQGGAAGFAKGGAKVALEELGPQQTRLSYDVDATVGGKLAQIGQRLVDGTAKKMADEFFSNFAAIVEGPSDEAPPAEDDAVEDAAVPPPQQQTTGQDVLRQNQDMIRKMSYFGVAAMLLALVYLLFAPS